MADINKKQITTLTFDCYGTLVDWESGACKALRALMPKLSPQITDNELIKAFLVADSRLITGGWIPYERVLAKVAGEVCASFGHSVDEVGEDAFVSSLPTWPLFAETNAILVQLSKKYRLAIISNINERLIAATLRNFSVPFDTVMTSETARSYKPEISIFSKALAALDEPAENIIHVAEGLCEANPARALGMASIWVRRSELSDDGSGAVPDASVSSLKELVDFLDEKPDL